ncbi:MAG: Na+/H+ antiporter NhaA [Actinomycetota bacterium]|nr:Na+/H+ antiporter NhaA [Actinomycetota bacterium]
MSAPARARERLADMSPWSGGTARPLQEFLRTEAGGAVLLLAATVVALVWANSPLSGAYEDLWGTKLTVSLGGGEISEDLRHWVNDGLMVFFFYVVGLEIRRELSMGELTDKREAAIPAVAALAGMVVPALVYVAFNLGSEAARGWGIVMATDIAFVLGALALLGPACPGRLRVFLLTLAIVDDIGAITVIAVFYSASINLVALAIAASILAAIVLLRPLHTWRGPAYFAAGFALWVAMVESGVHPTVAGVLLGMLTAVHPPRRAAVERAARATRSFRQAPTAVSARSAVLEVGGAMSPNERLQEAMHPWTSYVVVPLFALANAGVSLSTDALGGALGSPVTLGIIAGLVLGKLVGITAVSLAGVRLGLGALPRGVGARQLMGGAALAGIGFTVSLFVTDLAFEDPALREEAKVGVLFASALAAAVGWALFRMAARAGDGNEPDRPLELEPSVDLTRDHIRGRFNAPLTLVEYGDFECPFCGEATGTVAELRERFGDELRYVFRHLPLRDVHPHAALAAQAAEAAGAQAAFWPMHDLLFAHQDALELDDVESYATELGLDVARFATDLENAHGVERVQEHVDSAGASGVAGTPTFFVGGRRITGASDADGLAAELERSRGSTEAARTRRPREQPDDGG